MRISDWSSDVCSSDLLYRSRSEPIAGGAEQSILRDILLEAAAIIAAIPKEHEPDNMRAPIADELEGFAGMLSDGIQPSDMQDILAESAPNIASIPQWYEPQNMFFLLVAETEGYAASFVPTASSSLKLLRLDLLHLVEFNITKAHTDVKV